MVNGTPKAENFLKLMVILYADDMVVLADTPKSLHKALQSLETFCNTWKLKVNSAKTKIMVLGSKKGQLTIILCIMAMC